MNVDSRLSNWIGRRFSQTGLVSRLEARHGSPKRDHLSSVLLLGDIQAALGQEFLDVSVAEGETQIKILQIKILPRRERLGDHPGRQS